MEERGTSRHFPLGAMKRTKSSKGALVATTEQDEDSWDAAGAHQYESESDGRTESDLQRLVVVHTVGALRVGIDPGVGDLGIEIDSRAKGIDRGHQGAVHSEIVIAAA